MKRLSSVKRMNYEPILYKTLLNLTCLIMNSTIGFSKPIQAMRGRYTMTAQWSFETMKCTPRHSYSILIDKKSSAYVQCSECLKCRWLRKNGDVYKNLINWLETLEAAE